MTATAFMLPDQPDGITDDSRTLPDPARAVRRLRAYISATGDGLYDSSDPGDGPRPLYARDLEAVCRALEARTSERDAALTRADSHRRAAHEAASQLHGLRTERDRLRNEAHDRQAAMSGLRTQRDWLLAEVDYDTRARYDAARKQAEVPA